MTSDPNYDLDEILADAKIGSYNGIVPTTPNRPVHTDATASVYIYGLSLLCFNPKSRAAEIVFVKEHHTAPVLQVFGRDCEHVIEPRTLSEPVTVTIGKPGGSGFGACYTDGKKNSEDFAWMPDLAAWWGEKALTFRSGAGHAISAKVVLPDSLLYTKLLSVSDAVITDPRPPGKEVRTKIGRVLGANLNAFPADRLEIRIGDEPAIPLPSADGPYTISIRTDARMYGDHLPMIYNSIVIPPRGAAPFQMKYAEKEDEWEVCSGGAFKTTEYPCQAYGGGPGEPPEIPPV